MGGWGLGMEPAEPAPTERPVVRSRPTDRPPVVVVTRPEGRERELLERLRQLGYDALHVPLVAIEPLGDGPVDVSGYDWIVLTSVTGARELRRRMRGEPRRVAAIGVATADAFGGADVIATTSTQEGLLAVMPADPGRTLFAGAEGARPLLPMRLEAEIVALYRTVELRLEHWPEADLVVLASASAAHSYGRLEASTPAVSIGPETTRAARAARVVILAEAGTHDLEGLIAAVQTALGRS